MPVTKQALDGFAGLMETLLVGDTKLLIGLVGVLLLAISCALKWHCPFTDERLPRTTSVDVLARSRKVSKFEVDEKQGPWFIESTNIYTDFARSIVKVSLTFLGQFMLGWLYLISLQDNHEKNHAGRTAAQTLGDDVPQKVPQYAYWAIGAIGVQIGVILSANTNGHFGNTFEGMHWWCRVLQVRVLLDKDGGDFEDLELEPFVKYMRFIMSFLANSFLRDIILFSMPVFLMQSTSNMELVLNSFALTFLSTIDDTPNSKRFVLVLDGDDDIEDGMHQRRQGPSEWTVALPTPTSIRKVSNLQKRQEESGAIKSIGHPRYEFGPDLRRAMQDQG
eukprot:CAMPEP_0115337490 /NCGR_PEP_ID=MMETSP0270-20121206/89562_1 /TAXON_ID=71861 /ORGANISM="Scrippsiella trochoidea, Strain CCMP3099" /LENGTH=333 /DNA_ID=CAMNT_0002758723 /DNA_START=48 /DNA_END=1047 /DNA_ORIENTATION=+